MDDVEFEGWGKGVRFGAFVGLAFGGFLQTALYLFGVDRYWLAWGCVACAGLLACGILGAGMRNED